MKNKLLFIITGFLFFSLLFLSCSKDENPILQSPGKGEINIKSAMIKDGNLTPMELLGKNLYFDKISVPNSMSCADCHAPKTGYTGSIVGINLHGSVYRGADAQNFGNRKPPSSAYATFSPVFHYDATEGLFIGGNFWDGRATGERLGNPAAEQALGPFLNPAEHNVPDALTVLQKIENEKYIYLWNEVWNEPFSTAPDKIAINYDRIGLAIAAYEASGEVNQFTSKFDYYLKGMVELTPLEVKGLELFNDENKGKCSQCHISDGERPLFTDFTFDNLGVPKNPENPVYKYHPEFIDYGLGAYLQTRSDYKDKSDENLGKQKVPTLRNVDKRPGKSFVKAYTHNGVFKSLKEVVHFYNTRDVAKWPLPEVWQNVNKDEMGNLGLTDAEEDAIVAFMKTLSDGYVIK